MYDLIDRIVNLDIGQRGVTGLYAPARALVSEPLCLAAARHLAGLEPGDCVFIITGSLSRAQVTNQICENDGPIGAAVLARALSFGFNAIPVILSDPSVLDKIAKMVEMAGVNVLSLEEARTATGLRRFTGVAVMESCSDDDEEARAACQQLVESYQPKAVVTVERAGMTADGTYRDMLGQDYSVGRARLDYAVIEAAARGTPTIGIGDGGNEIGMGAVKAAVREHIPHGEVLCAELATDVLIPAGVSNWGCYAVTAALAVLMDKGGLAHTPALERTLIGASPMIGLVDGTRGTLEPTVDGLPVEVHASVVQMLANIVERSLNKK